MTPSAYIPEKFLPYLSFLPTFALVLGLVFDIFTLNRPDAFFENAVIIGYLIVSAITIVLLQIRTQNNSGNMRLVLLSVLQFSFGNLAGALMVLYARSGTFTGSAVFIGMLALLFLGNEMLRNSYARTHLRIIIWFTLLLTYSTLIVPILANTIGAGVFILSTIFALGITSIFIFLLSKITPGSFQQYTHKIILSTTVVTLFFSGLYFSNLIPPVPLALKHIGIYHDVKRINETYALQFERPAWYAFWRDTNVTYHHTAGTPAYCFSSIYAPRNLRAEVRHRWEKYNKQNDTWQTRARIPFPIIGGRLEGFRGYTQTSQVDVGRWRCSVETSRGTLIGRTEFRVTEGSPTIVQEEL